MIIWVNATVCGDRTMVGETRFMIVFSDWGRRAQEADERDGEQRKRECRVARRKWRFIPLLAA
jgi:hypothetical protein